MLFKTARIQAEYRELQDGAHATLLLPVLLFADEMSQRVAGIPLLLTGLMRTDQEHRDLIDMINSRRHANGLDPIKHYATPHGYWRAGDARTRHYTAKHRQEIHDRINGAFLYESSSGRILNTCLYHVGTASGHFHIQVPAGAIWAKHL